MPFSDLKDNVDALKQVSDRLALIRRQLLQGLVGALGAKFAESKVMHQFQFSFHSYTFNTPLELKNENVFKQTRTIELDALELFSPDKRNIVDWITEHMIRILFS